MVTAFRREFIVDAPREAAWRHFARVTAWPSWATYIKDVDVSPDGDLAANSVATLHLHKGPDTTFRMVEFAPYRHWMWRSRALWFTMDYDHVFEVVSDRQTRMILHMQVSGFGAWLFGKLIATSSQRGHQLVIPRLMAEMRTAR